MGSLPSTKASVGFIGLGSMGLGMANNLLRYEQFSVIGYDIWQPSVDKFTVKGGQSAPSPLAVAEQSQFLVLMAATSQQVDSILFDAEKGALPGLSQNGTILICSTVSPVYYSTLQSRITTAGRPDVSVVDCPVSGGPIRAANGTLSIFAAGEDEILAKSNELLNIMSERLYIISGGLGAGSKVKMVNQLLVGTQIAAGCEAIAFATSAGLDAREVFNIVRQTAGHSWAFNDRVPHILDDDWYPHSALDIFVKDLGIVVSTGRAVQFPLPVASTAEQLYISGTAQGLGREDDAALVKLLLRGPRQEQQPMISSPSAVSPGEPSKISKVASIGLRGVGHSLSTSVLQGGFAVTAFDSDPAAVKKFLANGGKSSTAASAAVAAESADVLLVNATGVEDTVEILFGKSKAAEALAANAVVILSADVTTEEVQSIEERLNHLNRGLSLVDAPLLESNNSRFESGLTMVYSGSEATVSRVNSVLISLARVVDVCRVKGNAGSASTVRLANQILVGIHMAAVSEALSLAAFLGLNTSQTFELLRYAAAWSWIFETRVPQMLEANWTSTQTVGDLARHLSTVLDEAKRIKFWAPLTSAAHNVYLSAITKGWGDDGDASLVRFYETESSSVAGNANKGIEIKVAKGKTNGTH